MILTIRHDEAHLPFDAPLSKIIADVFARQIYSGVEPGFKFACHYEHTNAENIEMLMKKNEENI